MRHCAKFCVENEIDAVVSIRCKCQFLAGILLTKYYIMLRNQITAVVLILCGAALTYWWLEKITLNLFCIFMNALW